MIWLLLSIFCSTMIFVVFKLFDRFGISNLQAIVVNYFVAFLVGFLFDGFEVIAGEIADKPWFSSIFILGFIFISLFQLMAYVSQKFGVSAVSVAVKMSMVIPVLFAVWHYHESLGFLKISGIICALLAVYLATRKPGKAIGGFHSIFLPAILFLGSGFLDAFLNYNEQELLLPHEHGYFTSLTFLVSGIMGLLILVFQFFKGREKAEWKSILGGISLGIPNYGSIYFLLRALDSNNLESSVIFPINNVGIVALSVICAKLLFSEKLSRLNKIGVTLALSAIIMIALQNYFYAD